MTKDPDTGRDEGDQAGRHADKGVDQSNFSHSDSGNSGGSKTTHGGPGTAGAAEQAGPGAPVASK
jgi:hypothetical protein